MVDVLNWGLKILIFDLLQMIDFAADTPLPLQLRALHVQGEDVFHVG